MKQVIMDVKEIFEDNPHTRGELFYKLYKKFSDMESEELVDIYANVLNQLTDDDKKDLIENELVLASLFLALADQYEKEEEYNEQVIEPAYEEFNKKEPPIEIFGFDSI